MTVRVCACGCGVALPADARADRKYVDATHRGRGHRADGAGAEDTEQSKPERPAHAELEVLVRTELAEVGRLDTSAGRVLVLAARRVEASDGASDALRQYWAARADAGLAAAPASPAPVEPTSDVEGGDDDEPKRAAGSTAITLELVS